MPTQSRGHGTRRSPDRGGSLLAIGASRWNRGLARCAKPPAGAALFCVCRTSRSRKRERIRGLMRPGLFSARRAPFRQTACKKRRESLAEAQSTQRKTRGTRFDLRLLPFIALQTFEILSACEDFIERSGFSPSLLLPFSACSAPLREILPSPPRRVPCPRLCVGMSSALRRAIDRFDEPQAASVFRKKRTPTKTGKRQRTGVARLTVTSTRFAVPIHRERCIAGCWQDDFRLRHSAKDPRTCPRKAVGMAPGAAPTGAAVFLPSARAGGIVASRDVQSPQRGRHSSAPVVLLGVGSANGYEGSCGPGFSLQGEPRFVKPPAKSKRISRRGAEHAEKDKGDKV